MALASSSLFMVEQAFYEWLLPASMLPDGVLVGWLLSLGGSPRSASESEGPFKLFFYMGTQSMRDLACALQSRVCFLQPSPPHASPAGFQKPDILEACLPCTEPPGWEA